MKLNASNCHLQKINSIRGFQGLCLDFMQSVMACLNFQNTSFREHPLMAVFIRFRSTSFSEDLKADAFFIKQPSFFFFSEYFYLKNNPKKHVPSFSLPWGERISSLIFIMFSSLLFTSSLFKNFSLLAKHKDFHFFTATLSTLNIIHKTYLHKKLIWVYIRITKLQYSKQKLFREVYWRTWFCRTVYTG